MKQVIVFSGTTEGRLLSWELGRRGISVMACVATEYGGLLAEEGSVCENTAKVSPQDGKSSSLELHVGRMMPEEMCELFLAEQPVIVVDATHPYAAVVSENIRGACEKTETEYLRLIRPSESAGEDICAVVDNVGEAVEYLRHTTGNVLLTTGSKELKAFTALPDYRERLYARVLSTPEVAKSCSELGFTGRHLICMQGPFSRELNIAMLRQVDARYLVTKESGKAGGFPEKLEAAREAGVKVVLIGRPPEQPGKTPEEVCEILTERFSLEEMQQQKSGLHRITLAGIGMGVPENMTCEVWEACRQADCIIGAQRMLESVRDLKKPVFASYKAEEIADFVKSHPDFKRIVLVLSGDVGFYSGAKRLLDVLDDSQYEIVLLPGISSVVYLCSRLQISWEDVKLCSIHGRSENLIAAVREESKVFTLLGGSDGVQNLCRELLKYGLCQVRLTIGEELHYKTERIVSGTPKELEGQTFGGLCAALIENPNAYNGVLSCIDDELFIRGKAPMTKSEVRSVSVAKLRLTRDAVVYDVGAGTGSVTIEMALQASEGMVYAVEKKEEAAALIGENMRRFGTPNIKVIQGLAPEALLELPSPTHVFIGGSSGNLREILQVILKKNPEARIVINAVTLETLAEIQMCLKKMPVKDAEIVQMMVSKAKVLGGYHLMMGQNPVYIVTCEGAGERLEV